VPCGYLIDNVSENLVYIRTLTGELNQAIKLWKAGTLVKAGSNERDGCFARQPEAFKLHNMVSRL